jgi:large subunit ribosomal protein L9
MKVVFIKDVVKVGKKNEIKEFPDGYAKFLIGKGDVVAATPNSVKNAEDNVSKQVAKKEKSVADFSLLAKKLSEVVLEIEATVNAQGHLFKAVKEEDIAKAIFNKINITVNENIIKIEKPFKDLGEYTVAIAQGSMHAEVKVIIKKK